MEVVNPMGALCTYYCSGLACDYYGCTHCEGMAAALEDNNAWLHIFNIMFNQFP
jgi:hypothetical protein